MMGSGMNLITTIIGFGMSATFIIFICIRKLCCRRRGFQSRPMFEIEATIDLEQPQHRAGGLEPFVVAAIPTMKFNREAFSSVEEDAQCSICLAEYQEKEILRIMPKCGHNFHLSCIDVWLRKQSTCPVCRLPLQDSSVTKHVIPLTYSSDQSSSRSEDSTDHEHTVGNTSNNGRIEPVPGRSIESIDSGELVTRG